MPRDRGRAGNGADLEAGGPKTRHERKLQRLEERRQARLAALEAKRRAQQRQRLVRTAVLFAVLAVAIFLVFFRNVGAPSHVTPTPTPAPSPTVATPHPSPSRS